MCRIAAWFGPPSPLSQLLFDAPHGLESQAYRPREMVSGHVNVDGTGLVWWSGEAATREVQRPVRYVSERPPWSDANLRELARLSAPVQLAAVRSATPGMPFNLDAVGPFVRDDWAFAHNGYLEDFRGSWQAPILARLDERHLEKWTGGSDSMALVLWLEQHLESSPELPLSERFAAWSRAVLQLGRELDRAVSLTCIVARRDGLWFWRAAHDLPPNTLYRCVDEAHGNSLRLSSEPMDDSNWELLAPLRVFQFTATDRSPLDFAIHDPALS
jgi:glutamine amidotransferase